jgi:hypothetical protein
MNLWSAFALSLVTLCTAGCTSAPPQHTWHLVRADSVGGHAAEVLGAPTVEEEGGRKALCFDGVSDGIILPVNPIAGWPRFTIEVLFKPDGDGPEEQRFLHIQDEAQRRVLLETRVTRERTWALDTFLHASASDRLTLLDRAKVHPTDLWYRAALVYDGATMSHYVNGVKQLEGAVGFPPMSDGHISLGVRQNRVHWFKGCIAEVRFTAAARVPMFR